MADPRKRRETQRGGMKQCADEPFGLGYAPDHIQQIVDERAKRDAKARAERAKPLAKQGRPSIKGSETTFSDGRGADYLAARLARDHRNAAMIWVIRNQFGRRNLALYTRAELALKLAPLVGIEAKARQVEHGGTAPGRKITLTEKLPQVLSEPENTSSKPKKRKHSRDDRTTASQLGKSAGVSDRTIRDAKLIADT